MNKYFKFIKDPEFRFDILCSRNLVPWMSDEQVLKKKFVYSFGRELDLDNPKTFNEKIQWLKLYDRSPEYTALVDKYEVKERVSQAIGEEYVIPTLEIWDSFSEIDFSKLPDQFVLKCTHDSGGLVIVRDKTKLDVNAARKKIEKSLRNNYYYVGREWPYKDVKPRIIAEQYMQDGNNLNLPVYKIMNFNGTPKIIQTIQNDKTKNEAIDYFDTQWNRLPFIQNYPSSEIPLKRQDQLEQMLELARKLSKGFSFIRTDFYVINGKIYFSEYTFYSDSGFAKFTPEDWDTTLGDWIVLPEKKINLV